MSVCLSVCVAVSGVPPPLPPAATTQPACGQSPRQILPIQIIRAVPWLCSMKNHHSMHLILV
ncbi:hypothetical protein M433DRAFT_10600 [Acidomyces richmondensis BFW]|nr:hypothetical protein M433DRAFT_10600 [Acidomyces richmondensis BFW]